MILAAHQPQFLPWLGYFDKMLRADVFVILDDVQFKKNECQNRNRPSSAYMPRSRNQNASRLAKNLRVGASSHRHGS